MAGFWRGTRTTLIVVGRDRRRCSSASRPGTAATATTTSSTVDLPRAGQLMRVGRRRPGARRDHRQRQRRPAGEPPGAAHAPDRVRVPGPGRRGGGRRPEDPAGRQVRGPQVRASSRRRSSRTATGSPASSGRELEDVLASGVDVLAALNPDDAASVIHELATASRGHSEDISRNLDANAELSGTFAVHPGPAAPRSARVPRHLRRAPGRGGRPQRAGRRGERGRPGVRLARRARGAPAGPGARSSRCRTTWRTC